MPRNAQNIVPLLLMLVISSAAPATLAHRPAPAARQATIGAVDQSLLFDDVEPEGEPISLSPDGQWIAIARDEEICTLDAATLRDHACAAYQGSSFDPSTATWSPDSSHLAFTEQYSLFFYEPDLWLLEADTGLLTNLTDDGVSGGALGDQTTRETAAIDQLGAWSPDGQTLVFVRGVHGDRPSTGLYRLDIGGGEPVELLTLSSQPLAASQVKLGWSPDGQTILYSVDLPPNVDGPGNGLWAVDASGANPRLVLGSAAFDGQAVYLEDVSAQGAVLLIFPEAFDAGRTTPLFAVADPRTGRVVPLGTVSSDPEADRVHCAAFSPDGSHLLLAPALGPLVVRNLDAGQDQVLADELITFVVPPSAREVRARWATNNLAICPAGARWWLRLQLEAD